MPYLPIHISIIKYLPIAFVLTIMSLSNVIYAQDTDDSTYNREAVVAPAENTVKKPANEVDTDSTFFFDDNDVTPALDEPELLAQNTTTGGNNSGGNSLSGFADTAWQTTFSDVRTRLASLATSDTSSEKVEIVSLENNKYILVKRNDILYRYNFYHTPYEVALLQNHELTKEDHDQKDALLYHVKVITSFISSTQVKEKLVKLHGPNTRTTVDKKKGEGVNIWELGAGLVFQWYEPYNKQPFTRSVDFISTEMAKKIMAEYAMYFDARERLILQKILLK